MKNKRMKKIINIILILTFGIGMCIVGGIIYSEYTGSKKEKELIREYENSISIGKVTSGKDILNKEKTKKENQNKSESEEKNSKEIEEVKNIWGLLEIKDIGVKAPIVNGVSEDNMKYSVVHFENSALPGEKGNCVLAAHNNIYGSIFEDLKGLESGDIISINHNNKLYTYKVYDKKVIEPSDFTVIDDSKESEITLITCTNRAKNRLVIKGILVS